MKEVKANLRQNSYFCSVTLKAAATLFYSNLENALIHCCGKIFSGLFDFSWPLVSCFFPDQVGSNQAGQHFCPTGQGEEGDHSAGGGHQVVRARPQEVKRQGRLVRSGNRRAAKQDEGAERRASSRLRGQPDDQDGAGRVRGLRLFFCLILNLIEAHFGAAWQLRQPIFIPHFLAESNTALVRSLNLQW